MAEPARQLIPEGFDEEDLGELAEPEETDAVPETPPESGQVIDGRQWFEDLNRRRQEQKDVKAQGEPAQPEPAQQQPENPELSKRKKEKAQGEADRVKSGEQKLKKATGGADAAAAGTAKSRIGNAAGSALTSGSGSKEDRKEQVKEAIKDQAKQEAKQYAKQLARQLGAQAKKAIAQAATKLLANPYVLGALAIILLIIIIIVVIFVLFSFDGQGGKGPAQFPETALQKQQSNFLLAISGDVIASDTAVKEVIDSELERYDRIKTNADTHNPDLSASIAAKKTELDGKLMGLLVEKAPERRKALRDQIQTEMLAFEATLPFGNWIAQLAEERVGQPNLQFCSITGATAKVACASFTSTVMYLAGVPNPIVSLVDNIWENSSLKIVVDRPATKTAGYYQDNKSKLQVGDIIFWGDGACSPEGSVRFDHVGFFVGNDQAIDTSSFEKKVLKRSAASRDSCRVFNGARRYGR